MEPYAPTIRSSDTLMRNPHALFLQMLLNPMPDDGEDAPDDFHMGQSTPETETENMGDSQEEGMESMTMTPTPPVTTVTRVPKKRGRIAFLPKMTNSERAKYYRSKRKVHGDKLTKDVAMLRSAVQRLEQLRSIREELSVGTRSTSSGTLVKIVREYMAQFRYGVQLPPARRDLLAPNVETSTVYQEAFMQSIMQPNVAFGEFRGVGVVMDQWERYSKFHALLKFELLNIRVIENDSGEHIVETTGQLRSRYSRRTIENVFPHIIGNEPLIQRLVGLEVVYPCNNQFYFSANGRVVRYNVDADFPTALVAAIGDLEMVEILLGRALIKQQHMMGVLQGEELAIVEQVESITRSPA